MRQPWITAAIAGCLAVGSVNVVYLNAELVPRVLAPDAPVATSPTAPRRVVADTDVPLPQPLPGGEGREPVGDGGVVYFLDDEDALTAEARAVLDEIAAQPRGKILVIEGHTDARGSDAYNDDLGRRRAERVAAYLAEQGLVPERLQLTSWGERRPAIEGDMEANRRVSITWEGGAE